MIVDYEYYTNIYNGQSLDETTFVKLNNKSQAIIEYLTRKPESSLTELSGNILNNVKNAICSEIEYINSNGGEEVLIGKDSNQYQSESYSSYSYQKGTKQSDTIQYLNGIPIAPMVNIYLSNTGLLYKGVRYAF